MRNPSFIGSVHHQPADEGGGSSLPYSENLIFDFDIDGAGASDGDLINLVNDASGNGHNLVSDGGTGRPFWTNDVGVLNGYGFAVFDGTTDWLRNATINQAQPITMYMVCKSFEAPGSIKTYFANTNASLLFTMRCSFGWDDYNFGGGAVTESITLPIGWRIYTVVATNTTSIIYTNNVAYINELQPGSINPLEGLTVGANRSSTPGQFGDLQITRLMAYAELHDATKRSNMWWYLDDRYF